MYIVVGLGNPGVEYEKTRHNTGFITLDKFANKYGIEVTKEKHKALIGMGNINGEKILLVKPQTYMNLSGEAVREVVDFYKEDIKNVVVIFDDIDLPIGTIRIKDKGSSGTHNGVRSIVNELNSQYFKRVKVGIGKPQEKEKLVNYVLGKFSKEEYNEIENSTTKAVSAIELIIKGEIISAMNKYN